ncbi:O-methyltransferase [Flavobacteriaceae bacterium MAR_2010_188]|nr:O-methyltransferase [Flavobacteriaceae bacterium MAR_2010_188]
MLNDAKSKKNKRAVDALQEAQRIAFAPFVFQTSVALKRMGVLDLIFENRSKGGISLQGISEQLKISEYGLGVLLEMAESSDIVEKDENEKFELTKIGYFLNFDKAINVNLNFTNDVCYQGLFHLQDAVKEEKPSGLKELGDWKTVYEGLSQLPENIQKSWFAFDHHYSDEIFDEALKIVFDKHPKTIFDIGGNTGKFALKCLNYNSEVEIKIFDLPGQLQKALKNIETNGFGDRGSGFEIDWLSENPQIIEGADIIWMSQFLDCFSEQEILKILKSCAASMDSSTELLITETFTDRQEFANAKFILEATSLYFTAIANGNSKMYPATVFERIIDDAGLKIKDDISIGEYHTMLVCKLK